MGLLRAFVKGLFGDSPQKFIADIMNVYFNAIGRGYTHQESMNHVIRSRYPYSSLKQEWIHLSLKISHNDEQSNEESLKGLVFTIWYFEMDPKANPGDVPPFYVTRIEAQVKNDPILLKFFNDLDDVYDCLTSKA